MAARLVCRTMPSSTFVFPSICVFSSVCVCPRSSVVHIYMQVGCAHAGTMDWEDPQMLEWYKQKIYHFWGAMVGGGGIEGESFLFYKVFPGRCPSLAKDACLRMPHERLHPSQMPVFI